MFLEDTDKMPFGQHKNKEMQDVPAQYLLWLGGELSKKDHLGTDQEKVYEYINENKDVLQKEINESQS